MDLPKPDLASAGVGLHAQVFQLLYGILHLKGKWDGFCVDDLGLDCDCDAEANDVDGEPEEVLELMGVRDLVWLSVVRGSSHDGGMMHVLWGYWQVRFKRYRARAKRGELCSEMEPKVIGVKCLF